VLKNGYFLPFQEADWLFLLFAAVPRTAASITNVCLPLVDIVSKDRGPCVEIS
jgi:hypothetical protein